MNGDESREAHTKKDNDDDDDEEERKYYFNFLNAI